MSWRAFKKGDGVFPDKITYTKKEVVKKSVYAQRNKDQKMKGFFLLSFLGKDGREANKMLLCLKHWED